MEFRSRAAEQPLSRKRRRTAAKGRNWKGMHDPDIVIELMSATSNVKSIRNTFATARAFARFYAKHRNCSVQEVIGNTTPVNFDTLRKAHSGLKLAYKHVNFVPMKTGDVLWSPFG